MSALKEAVAPMVTKHSLVGPMSETGESEAPIVRARVVYIISPLVEQREDLCGESRLKCTQVMRPLPLWELVAAGGPRE